MNSQEKRVGVFMRVYRNEPTLHQAIQSVLTQTYTNFKYYILVNQNTKAVVQQYQNEDSRIEILDGKEGEGFRTYAKYVASENIYVTTIDADDWYEKTYLEELIYFAEKNRLDVAACGNFFTNQKGEILGSRVQKSLIWNTKDTDSVLKYIYVFFRTIWGKLVRAEVFLDYDEHQLPASIQYGGYGGDTLFMFNLLYHTRKVGIIDKSLYNYRMSPSSNSYKFSEGRLDSDELLFNYVKTFLDKTGYCSQQNINFLYLVYGNAMLDTIKLILAQRIPEEQRGEELLYIFEKETTKNLLYKERMKILKEDERTDSTFTEQYWKLIFAEPERYLDEKDIAQKYLLLLEWLRPKYKGVLDVEEFMILSKNRDLLDALLKENYLLIFNTTLDSLSKVSEVDKKKTIEILRKFNSQVILDAVLTNQEFVIHYVSLFKTIENGDLENALNICENYFEDGKTPKLEEILVELWINLSALLEQPDQFIRGKQTKLQILLKEGKAKEAQQEYEDLREMGVIVLHEQ